MSKKLMVNKVWLAFVGAFTIKNIQSGHGHDGRGLNCELYHGKTHLFDSIDDGAGGGMVCEETTPDTLALMMNLIEENKLQELLFNNGYEMMKEPAKVCVNTIVCEMTDTLFNLKNRKKDIAKFNRFLKKAIVYGVDHNKYKHFSWSNTPSLAALLKYNNGLELLQKAYDDAKSELKKGEKILNNLKELKSLGVKL